MGDTPRFPFSPDSTLKNPWAEIPLSDYEGHMVLPQVGQSKMLADELHRLLQSRATLQRPERDIAENFPNLSWFTRISTSRFPNWKRLI